ncbi:MAG: hypothetical protein A2648_00770 [Candidatus Lloydbacteria bacterium RIFCSPHIGHO2_01_FULL_41_20]|uniref:Uncharacterized protein n=1 Tax=Candidatus Lloydbacteria bacterium RIFCSPHIGHO2_01_FULL_41_20 TaxID=1798657 RepID=A0A1G2CVN8_9BACT|nr:MAG: hypothetical protein A2648_00770 [Candidatus Lloydbacteria bacterium RIFCSPHIGHO2_01_FULL_41_20]
MTLHIKNFLNKFLKLDNENRRLKKELIEIININLNLIIRDNQIEISNSNILIKTTPLVKNEIFIKKEGILKEFNKKTGKNIISIN